MSVTAYPKLGRYTVIPAADLLNIASSANVRGPARLGDAGFGKRAGIEVLRDAGGGDLRVVFATGDAPSAPWKVVDNSATYTPV